MFVQGRIPSQWLVDQMPEAIWATDGALRFVVVGGAAAKALGLDPERVLGTSVYDYFHTTDSTYPPLAAHLRALQGQVEGYRFEVGGRVYSVRVGPIRHAIGRVVGVVGCATDVTDLVAAAELASLRWTLEALPVWVLRTDDQLRVRFANDAARRQLAPEVEGKTLAELASGPDVGASPGPGGGDRGPQTPGGDFWSGLEELARKAWHTGTAVSADLRRLAEGTERVYRTHASPELDPQGHRRGVVLVGWDVTEAVRELEAAQREARRWEGWAEAAGRLAQAQDPAALADQLLQAAQQLSGARHGAVALWEAEGLKPLVQRATGAASEPAWDRVREQASVGEALWLELSDPEEARTLGLPEGRFRRALVVPVRGQDVFGVLVLAWQGHDPEPSEDACPVVRLARLAGAVGSGLVRTERERRSADLLQRLQRVSHSTAGAEELAAAPDRWLAALVETLGATGAAVYALEGEVWARVRHAGERQPASTFGAHEGVVAEAARTGTLQTVRPTRTDPAFVGHGLEGVALPVLGEPRPHVLALESPADKGFDASQLAMAEAAVPELAAVLRWLNQTTHQLAQADRYRHLLEAETAGVLVLDGSRVVRYVNPAAAQLLGRSPEELVGGPFLDSVHPDDRAEASAALSRAYADPQATVTFPVRLVRRDGSSVWVEVSASNRLDDPRVGGLVLSVRDVTEARAAHEALAARAAELEAAREFEAALRASPASDLAATIAQRTAQLLRADHAALVLQDPDGDSFTVAAVHGHLSELSGASFPVAGVYGHVMTTGAASRWEAVPEDVVFVEGHGLGPLLVAPLRTGWRTLGALGVARRATSPLGPFDDRDADRLAALAEMAADFLHRTEEVAALERAYTDVVLSLARAMDAHDGMGPGHGTVVAHWAEAVARRMGCSPSEAREVRWAALLHNVGKVAIPEEILRKAGPLSADELALVQRYPVIGEQILEAVPRFRGVARLVRHHRERWDGTGYPDGLRGEEIPLGSRIIAVVDAYNAMTDHRRYRVARGHAEAVAELQRHAGSQFDPQVVQAFLELLEESRAL